MPPIFEYECDQGHKSEAFVKIDDRKNPIKCRCGREAQYKISAPSIHLDGTDPGFPDAHEKWADRHEKMGKTPEAENLTHI